MHCTLVFERCAEQERVQGQRFERLCTKIILRSKFIRCRCSLLFYLQLINAGVIGVVVGTRIRNLWIKLVSDRSSLFTARMWVAGVRRGEAREWWHRNRLDRHHDDHLPH